MAGQLRPVGRRLARLSDEVVVVGEAADRLAAQLAVRGKPTVARDCPFCFSATALAVGPRYLRGNRWVKRIERSRIARKGPCWGGRIGYSDRRQVRTAPTKPQDVFSFGGDKQWIAIDKTAGIGRGNIYQLVSSNTNAKCQSGLRFTRSTDGGLTWMPQLPLPVDVFSHTMSVDRSGSPYLFGSAITAPFPPPFHLVRSVDAENPAVTPTFEFLTEVDLDGVRAFAGWPNPGGLIGQAWIALDVRVDPRGTTSTPCRRSRG